MNKFIYMAAFGIALIGTPALAEDQILEETIFPSESQIFVESIVEPATEAATVRRMKIECFVRPNVENNTVDADSALCIPFYRNLIMGTVQGTQTTSPFSEVGQPRYND